MSLMVNPINFLSKQPFGSTSSIVKDASEDVVKIASKTTSEVADTFEKTADKAVKKITGYAERYEEAVKRPDFFEM